MAAELHVVTIGEFEERSQELAREVHDTGKPLFVMDGDQMVVRVLPPDAPLTEIEINLAVFDDIQAYVKEQRQQ